MVSTDIDIKPKRLMLVDESAFIFAPKTDEEKEQNAYTLIFISDASRSFDVAMVTAGNPDALKNRLAAADLSEALNEKYRRDQKFLSNDIRTWDDVAPLHADVFISADKNQTQFIESHDFYEHPEGLQAPDYFWHFIENYEDNLDGIEVFRGLDTMMANLRTDEIKRQRFISAHYVDPDAFWKRVASSAPIINLLNAFGTAAERSWNREHPQDEVLKNINRYFELAAYVAAGGKGGKLSICRELLSYRGGIATDFKMKRIDDQYETLYDRTEKIEDMNKQSRWELPLIPQHRQLLHDALRAIHRIIREEPRLSAPK